MNYREDLVKFKKHADQMKKESDVKLSKAMKNGMFGRTESTPDEVEEKKEEWYKLI